ncbi:hypothetical protein DSO57_1038929 [Entomophthora muscae]|uniref:Uncharacterized protein n=1 Tax=Entomophthora muscae TaxID=34485 RepID=A0ACC2U7W7_9FUNG|nr:hypothetical protein DSO57_1038929 [Entomophthora muscae]
MALAKIVFLVLFVCLVAIAEFAFQLYRATLFARIPELGSSSPASNNTIALK